MLIHCAPVSEQDTLSKEASAIEGWRLAGHRRRHAHRLQPLGQHAPGLTAARKALLSTRAVHLHSLITFASSSLSARCLNMPTSCINKICRSPATPHLINANTGGCARTANWPGVRAWSAGGLAMQRCGRAPPSGAWPPPAAGPAPLPCLTHHAGVLAGRGHNMGTWITTTRMQPLPKRHRALRRT